ncbi:MAG TPA: hypothetical protein VG713_00490, partial [Pirellulales bacterium]|nr:hypothetical protein [Pirellulales bacterium]
MQRHFPLSEAKHDDEVNREDPVDHPQETGCCYQTNRDGFRIDVLRSEAVEIAVVPQLGAKILSLTHLRTGRQWLWLPQEARLFANTPLDPFENSTLLGADECVPTVSPCQINGRAIADHGEAWGRPWELDSEKLRAGEVTTSVILHSPLRLGRTISLRGRSGQTVQIDYRLSNLADDSQPFIWAFHPLMKIDADDDLILPIDSVLV